jgi:peptidoglycan/LPS O-acetylase OafA/YrhL
VEYRKELDSLRAIAVIAVIIYHVNTNYLPNGFLGVDIFLVLSGFLITSVIQQYRCKDVEIGFTRQHLLVFLKRRFFRIYPAYFTVICLTLIVAVMTLPKPLIVAIKKAALYSLLGVPNFFYFNSIHESYFEIHTLYPLLHLWSLGLEIQFYCVWGIILLFADKWRLNLKYLIIFIALLSFITAIYLYSNPKEFSFFGHKLFIDKKFVFYFLPTRIWEFAVGAFASVYITKASNRMNHVLSFIGITMILTSLGLKNIENYSPYLAVLPCIGTFLLIVHYRGRYHATTKNVSQPRFSIVPRTVGPRPNLLEAIGLISYSLYLWHFPIIEFFKYCFVTYTLTLQIISALLLILLSIFSYKYVESYFRTIKTKSFLAFSKYGTAFACAVLLSFLYNQKELNSDFYKFTSDYPGSCLYHPWDNKISTFNKQGCIIGKSGYQPNILVVGSSLTNQFVPFLAHFAETYGFSFVNITANSTDYRKEYALKGEYEHDQARIKLHDDFYKLVRTLEPNFDILITSPSWAESEKKLFSQTLREWSSKFKMIIVINPIPSPSNFELKRHFFQKEILFSSNHHSDFLQSETQKYANVFYISLNDLILKGKGLDDHHRALFFDAGHLNIGGSLFLAKKLINSKRAHILKSSQFVSLAKLKKA